METLYQIILICVNCSGLQKGLWPDTDKKKIIPYYTYDNGRVYYKASEVEKFMKKKGNDPKKML